MWEILDPSWLFEASDRVVVQRRLSRSQPALTYVELFEMVWLWIIRRLKFDHFLSENLQVAFRLFDCFLDLQPFLFTLAERQCVLEISICEGLCGGYRHWSHSFLVFNIFGMQLGRSQTWLIPVSMVFTLLPRSPFLLTFSPLRRNFHVLLHIFLVLFFFAFLYDACKRLLFCDCVFFYCFWNVSCFCYICVLTQLLANQS